MIAFCSSPGTRNTGALRKATNAASLRQVHRMVRWRAEICKVVRHGVVLDEGVIQCNASAHHCLTQKALHPALSRDNLPGLPQEANCNDNMKRVSQSRTVVEGGGRRVPVLHICQASSVGAERHASAARRRQAGRLQQPLHARDGHRRPVLLRRSNAGIASAGNVPMMC